MRHSLTFCQKCNGIASIKNHQLCRACYYKYYNAGTLPTEGFFWEEKSPYTDKDNWLENLYEMLPGLYHDEKCNKIILVVKSREDYKNRLDHINYMKQVFKKLDFDVRDQHGNFITINHHYHTS